jgi:hypothetical protein
VCTECANTWLQSRAAGLARGAWSWRLAALCLAAGLITFALERHAL